MEVSELILLFPKIKLSNGMPKGHSMLSLAYNLCHDALLDIFPECELRIGKGIVSCSSPVIAMKLDIYPSTNVYFYLGWSDSFLDDMMSNPAYMQYGFTRSGDVVCMYSMSRQVIDKVEKLLSIVDIDMFKSFVNADLEDHAKLKKKLEVLPELLDSELCLIKNRLYVNSDSGLKSVSICNMNILKLKCNWASGDSIDSFSKGSVIPLGVCASFVDGNYTLTYSSYCALGESMQKLLKTGVLK